MNEQGLIVNKSNSGEKTFCEIIDDPKHLAKTPISRMVVDDTGNHCFLLAKTVIFYNHWQTDQISKIDLLDESHFVFFKTPENKLQALTLEISDLAIKIIAD